MKTELEIANRYWVEVEYETRVVVDEIDTHRGIKTEKRTKVDHLDIKSVYDSVADKYVEIDLENEVIDYLEN